MTSNLKFYTDEHVPTAIVKSLRLKGVDVLTTKDANMLGARDEEHLVFALREDRVLITQDKDFLALHAKGIEHCGIVYGHQHKSIGVISKGIMLVYQVLETDDMKNHLEYL